MTIEKVAEMLAQEGRIVRDTATRIGRYLRSGDHQISDEEIDGIAQEITTTVWALKQLMLAALDEDEELAAQQWAKRERN
jgi:hypothetical protein